MSSSARSLSSALMPQDATDIALESMDASVADRIKTIYHLIGVHDRARPGGPIAVKEAKTHQHAIFLHKTKCVYPIFVPSICDNMV